MNHIRKQLARAVESLKSFAAELWNSAAESGFCCGIRLAAQRPQEIMPTAGSCCGVRM
ncbi:MAG TPA: hypothetical protein VF786_12600 [Terriglobales bacterium]